MFQGFGTTIETLFLVVGKKTLSFYRTLRTPDMHEELLPGSSNVHYYSDHPFPVMFKVAVKSYTVNPLLSPPGGLFFPRTFEGGLNREGGLI